MSPLLHAVTIIVSVLFLLFVIVCLKRNKMILSQSLIWLFLGIVGVIGAIFPQWVYALSDILGFETPVNFLFLACIVFLFVIAIIQNISFSKQIERVTTLSQELSLLKHEFQELENTIQRANQQETDHQQES